MGDFISGLCAAGIVTDGSMIGTVEFVRSDGRTATYAHGLTCGPYVSVTDNTDRAVVWGTTSVAVVDFDANELTRVDIEPPDAFCAAALSADGRTLVVATERGKLDVYAID